MSKKKTKVEEEVIGLSDEQEQAIDKETAAEIEKILKLNDRALQPFLVTGPEGVFPRVRLVRMPKVDGEA